MSIAPGPCPHADILEGIAAGGAEPGDVRAHLAVCASCRDALARMREDNRFLSGFAVAGALPAVAPPDTGRGVNIPGYEYVREIHHGGQGVVHLARHRATKRQVAIKLMKQGPFATTADRARFEREVETLSRLNHPNIVAVHDAGVVAGYQFFVMDYIDGEALDEALPGLGTRIAGAAGDAGRERLITAGLETFIKVCDAVHAAHLRGVIHRDLKPSNIRVDGAGEPHVLDFGLAKSTTAEVEASITRTGQFVGSLPWASPEQVEGNSARIDLRTDVYSLGTMLFQLLTGALPFDVESGLRDAVADILYRAPPAPSAVGSAAVGLRIRDELDTIVLKCLAKDRERRYQTAGELARDLRRCLAGEAIEAKRDSAIYMLRKTLRRYRMRVAAAGAFVALLGVFAIVMVVLYRQSARLEHEAVDAAESLTDLLSQSNLEKGRMAGLLGNMHEAEQLLWREMLTERVADGEGAGAVLRSPPGPVEAYWGLWELYRRYQCLRTVVLEPAEARTATLADDGVNLWVAGRSGQIRKISPSGEVLAEVRSPGAAEAGLILSNERGDQLMRVEGRRYTVWRREGGELREWDTGKLVNPLVTGLILGRGGTRMAGVCDGMALVWTVGIDEPTARFSGDDAALSAVGLSNDERRLAARDRRGNLYVWDLESGARVAQAAGAEPRPEDLHPLGELTFSPDDRKVADAWVDIPGRIWDLTTNPPRATELAERPGEYRVQAFSGDGEKLAIGDLGGALWIFDVRTGEKLASFVAHPGRMRSVFFTGDGRGVWTCGEDSLRLWEVAADAGVRTVRVEGEHFHGVDISPDGKWITAGGSLGVLLRIDAETLEQKVVAFGNDVTVSCVASSPDGKWLAASSYGQAAYVWAADDVTAPRLGFEHPTRVSHVCFTPDSKMLATASDDGSVRMWRLADGVQTARDWQTRDRMPQIAVAPAGRKLVAAVRDGALEEWDIATGDRWTLLPVTHQPLRAVCFAPDGGRMFVGGADRCVRVWDVAAGRCVQSLAGHNQEIFCVAISADGAMLASGDTNGGIRMWDAHSYRLLATLDGHKGPVMALRFSPDNRRLVSASLDGSVRVWDLGYYGRHIAGNLVAQLQAIPPAASDPARAENWRRWARQLAAPTVARTGAGD